MGTPFDRLPREILLEIVSNLPNLSGFFRTCHSTASVASEESFWKLRLMKEYNITKLAPDQKEWKEYYKYTRKRKKEEEYFSVNKPAAKRLLVSLYIF